MGGWKFCETLLIFLLNSGHPQPPFLKRLFTWWWSIFLVISMVTTSCDKPSLPWLVHTAPCDIYHKHWHYRVCEPLRLSGCCCHPSITGLFVRCSIIPTTLGATSDTGPVEGFSVLAEHLLVRIHSLVAYGTPVRWAPLWTRLGCHLSLLQPAGSMFVCLEPR